MDAKEVDRKVTVKTVQRVKPLYIRSLDTGEVKEVVNAVEQKNREFNRKPTTD